MKMKCIICFRHLVEALSGEEEIENLKCGPDDGVYFSSVGNFGSCVFDCGEFTGQYMEIYICDQCLRNRAHMIIIGNQKKEILGVLQDQI